MKLDITKKRWFWAVVVIVSYTCGAAGFMVWRARVENRQEALKIRSVRKELIELLRYPEVARAASERLEDGKLTWKEWREVRRIGKEAAYRHEMRMIRSLTGTDLGADE